MVSVRVSVHVGVFLERRSVGTVALLMKFTQRSEQRGALHAAP